MPTAVANQDALLIFNPVSGRSQGARLGRIDRARVILSRDGIETELAPTDGPGHTPGGATEIARKAVRDGRQLVIVCGGDGTINEVVNGLAGSQVPLALLPAGTANVLAKELTLPWNIEKAAARVASSEMRRIALGFVTTSDSLCRSGGQAGRYFLSVAGAGPDGAIVYTVHAGLKKTAGTLAYWAEGMRLLGQYNFPRFRVTVDGKTIDATLIVVGRTKHYGGPFRITTEAGLHNDDFELMVLSTRSRLLYLAYLPLLWVGQLRRARHAHFLKATTVRVDPLDDTKAHVQVDGETAGRVPAEFRIVPDALTLAVPRSLTREPV